MLSKITAINSLEIQEGLNNKNNYQIEVLRVIDSTNTRAKTLKENGSNINVIISETQTGGRGRLNRKFYSEEGSGIYLSVVLAPKTIISNSVKITTFSAVAVARAIENLCGVPVQIKWVNDLFMGGKKVCGILTESVCDFENNNLKYAVLGVGINVKIDNFPKEIQNIATDLYSQSGKIINRNKLISLILNELDNLESQINTGDYLSEYKARSIILNKEVIVENGSDKYIATAIDITNSGQLVVDKNGEKITINAGDVSLRF